MSSSILRPDNPDFLSLFLFMAESLSCEINSEDKGELQKHWHKMIATYCLTDQSKSFVQRVRLWARSWGDSCNSVDTVGPWVAFITWFESLFCVEKKHITYCIDTEDRKGFKNEGNWKWYARSWTWTNIQGVSSPRLKTLSSGCFNGSSNVPFYSLCMWLLEGIGSLFLSFPTRLREFAHFQQVSLK